MERRRGMNKLFEHLSANWFHYMDYEWRTAKDGLEYLMPTADESHAL